MTASRLELGDVGGSDAKRLKLVELLIRWKLIGCMSPHVRDFLTHCIGGALGLPVE